MSRALIQQLGNAGRDFEDYGNLAPVVLMVEGMGEQTGLVDMTSDGLIHLRPYVWESLMDLRTREVRTVATGWADNGWLIDPARVIAWRFAEQLPPLD